MPQGQIEIENSPQVAKKVRHVVYLQNNRTSLYLW